MAQRLAAVTRSCSSGSNARWVIAAASLPRQQRVGVDPANPPGMSARRLPIRLVAQLQLEPFGRAGAVHGLGAEVGCAGAVAKVFHQAEQAESMLGRNVRVGLQVLLDVRTRLGVAEVELVRRR